MKKKSFLILIGINLIFFLISGRAITESKVFNSITDAWIDQGSPSTNHGSDAELRIGWQDGNRKDTLIRFNLSSRPANYNKVEIQFYCIFVEVDRIPIVIIIDEFIYFEWDENNITWNDGRYYGDRWTIASMTISNTGINRIDITYYHSPFLDENYGIWLYHLDTELIIIASRENSLMSPRLVFFYEVSNLPIIIIGIVVIISVSIGGVLGYFIYRTRSRSRKMALK